MLKVGMFVRCPIDMEHPNDPRIFATGKVVSINDFNETAHIVFSDPAGYRKYFEYIPKEVEEAPIFFLSHCHLFKGSKIKHGRKTGIVVDYKKRDDGGFDYYVQDENTKEYYCVSEENIEGSFLSGSANPKTQLSKYEFQNPCWYLGRQIVKDTMNILDNSVFGFKELAGCKIYLKAFQINTIMRCLQDDVCRYMIADEVGLGKTIEACSILKIFLCNKAKRNILIAVPRALAPQWRTELLFKFGILEGENSNENTVQICAVEDIDTQITQKKWDFIVVDEVHNYINHESLYEKIHNLSKSTENILLLSATPIQQRQGEYLKLLRLILPQKYDDIGLETFVSLVEKQKKISRITHSLLDEIDSFRNELLPEIDDENPHDNEDVQDELEEILDDLEQLSSLIDDANLKNMISSVDTQKDDFGIYSIQVIISYICENYQIERNIIRGRRAILGVYPKDEEGQFAERSLAEISYDINDDCNYYEYEAYRTLKEWIVLHQNEFDDISVINEIKPLLEAFFSSPWAYIERLKQIYGKKGDLPDNIWKTAERWVEEEESVIENMADTLDDVESHPSRLVKIVNYIDTELFGKKVVVFTDQPETFDKYYTVLKDAFGDEVTGFATSIDKDEAEINIYKFQSNLDCNILICDKSGGEGRNLQIADYVVHIDLPWNINAIEQRIGRLDRMGRNVTIPVTSVVVHTTESYEEQLFNFWNQGLSVFRQSLSGLEIIMNDINNKIIETIKNDFEYGLYRLIPELIKEAEQMRETVQREQIFDTAALRYKPLYNQLERLLNNYQFNENKLFAQTMMSWASLAGFGELGQDGDSGLVSFDENSFSIKSAQNSLLVPPNWDNYLSKKQNEIVIRVQRGLEEEKKKNISHNNRIIKGSFDRDVAIKNDYIHFYAPGDEIFDCITENAMHSYKGMATAFAAISKIDWKGFVYSYSIEPDEKMLIDNGISLFSLGLFRQYLATSIQVVAVPFNAYKEIPEKTVLSEHKRISRMGYFNRSDEIEHLGRRGKEPGFLQIANKYSASNVDWFRAQYPEEKWVNLVDQSASIARKRARERFGKDSNLKGAKEMIDQILSAKESRAEFYGVSEDVSIEQMRKQYQIIYESLSKPVVRTESACFMWLVKRNG